MPGNYNHVEDSAWPDCSLRHQCIGVMIIPRCNDRVIAPCGQLGDDKFCRTAFRWKSNVELAFEQFWITGRPERCYYQELIHFLSRNRLYWYGIITNRSSSIVMRMTASWFRWWSNFMRDRAYADVIFDQPKIQSSDQWVFSWCIFMLSIELAKLLHRTLWHPTASTSIFQITISAS